MVLRSSKGLLVFVRCVSLGMLWVLSGCGGDAGQSKQQPLMVYAAASLSDVVRQIAEAFEAETGQCIQFNVAGSGTLAQQVRTGVAADLFLSANEHWMDVVEQEGFVAKNTRSCWLKNRLVVVGNKNGNARFSSPYDLVSDEFTTISIGDPAYVPAGKYAEKWLSALPMDRDEVGAGATKSSLWDELNVIHRLTFQPDVRSALMQSIAYPRVASIVYRTDYLSYQDRVVLLYEVPANAGIAIRYSSAVLNTSHQPEKAMMFLEFLTSDQAKGVLIGAGFELAEDDLASETAMLKGSI